MTRRARPSTLALAAAVAGFAVAPDARADEPSIAVELGARAGVALPLGSVDAHPTLGGGVANDPLHETAAFTVPLWFDAGVRFARRWYTGAFVSIAPGSLGPALGDGCNSSGIDCSVLDLRAGVDVHYHLRPGRTWDPWVGVGVGYEWLTVHAYQPTGSYDEKLEAKGWEFANLQAGLDCHLAARLGVGPFVALTVAEYSSESDTSGLRGFDGARALHGWFVLGVRAAVDLGGAALSLDGE